MRKIEYLLLPLLICISGCTTAFEIGESLNQASTNIANILGGTVEPASAPAAASEPVSAPAEETK